MLNKQSFYGTKLARDVGTAIKKKNHQSNYALFAMFIIFTSFFSQMKWGRPVVFPIQVSFALRAVTLLAQTCRDRTSRTSGEC